VREPQRVVGDALLHRRPHVWRGTEVPVRRDQPLERLVRPLEVVGVHEEADATLAVREVREDRARQELVPQSLPEALDLPQGLRVLGPALHVPDPFSPQLLLEFRLAAPGRVLPTLVGQDLLRRPVRRRPAP